MYILLSKCPNFDNTLFIWIERFIKCLSRISAIITKAAAKPKILERENSLGQKFKSIVFFYSFNYSFQKLVERAEQVYPYKSPWFYACQFTVKENRVFAFDVFLNVTTFNFGFKDSI